MSTHARHISRIAATLLLAFAVIFVARAPMEHPVAEAAEPAAVETVMPCGKTTAHAETHQDHKTADHTQSAMDQCCGGALCAGYTIDTPGGTLTPAAQSLSFSQSPPDALHVADIALPKRPPRFL